MSRRTQRSGYGYFVGLAVFILCALCSISPAKAQNEKPTVGLVVRPIIPSTMFSELGIQSEDAGLKMTIDSRYGYGFGGVLRQGLGRVFSLESGIYYTRRNYTAKFTSGNPGGPDTFSATEDFAFVDYEIPAMALIYIRISDRFYLNNAFGLTFDFFPNDLEKRTDVYKLFGLRKYWVLPGMEAMTGIEYRTAKHGFFYLGGSYHRMLTNMGAAELIYNYDKPTEKQLITYLAGHYFALELKYFFSNQRYAPPVY